MIKLQQPANNDFRCGDVLWAGPTCYNVCCSLCGQRLPYEVFPQHFRLEHLTEVDAGTQTEEQQLDVPVEVEVQPLAIKLEDDPIAHDEINASDNHEHVDLAQIALLDQDHETDKEAVVIAADETEGTIAKRRVRRTAALKNLLVQSKNETLQVEQLDNWMATDVDVGRTCTTLGINENSNESELYDDEDDEEAEEDDARDMLFQCDQCDRAYNTKRSLQSHHRSKHGKLKLDNQSKTPPADDTAGAAAAAAETTINGSHKKKRSTKGPAKVYKCNESECNQTFRTERDLRGHRWKHTGIYCDICGKPFTQSGNMMRHRQRHSGIKPYKCQEPECEATFYTQKELTSHNICHTGRMPCICEVCGRPCRDRGVLTAHMRRHTGERPAKCEVCGKAFYSFHDLNVHAVSHTSLRPFVCDVCGSTFQRKKALRVHKLLHSEQRKYSCKLCSKSFAQSGGLNAHMRTHESARTKAKAKAKSKSETTSPTVGTIIELENTRMNVVEELQEAVTIEIIQEEHTTHMEVVAVDAAGSWHVT